MAALELGITTVKFFPANVYGGLASIRALYPHLRYVALTERRTFSAEVNSFCAKLYDGENGRASRADSTGDSGRRNRFPTRIHTKKGRSALILRTFCPEKREWTF